MFTYIVCMYVTTEHTFAYMLVYEIVHSMIVCTAYYSLSVGPHSTALVHLQTKMIGSANYMHKYSNSCNSLVTA